MLMSFVRYWYLRHCIEVTGVWHDLHPSHPKYSESWSSLLVL